MTEAARPPDCPACERSARTDAGRAESVVKLTADPAWAEAVASAPVCLEHLLALMAVGRRPARTGVEERQLARLTALADLLDGYSHTSSYDRRDRQTGAQRAAPDQASAVLAGRCRTPTRRRPVDEGPVLRRRPAMRPSARRRHERSSSPASTVGQVDSGRRDRRPLEAATVPTAVIDVDWLGWCSVPGGFDEHDDPRLTMANLAAMRATYLAAGVRFFVLAWRLRDDAQLDRLRDVLGMPLAVVCLEAPLDVIERRLAPDPTASRADDLEVARGDLATGEAACQPRTSPSTPTVRSRDRG